VLEKDFPLLNRKVNGKRIVYLDNAATTQKPLAVINALREFYETSNANVHRALNTISFKATKQFEEARQTIADFINADASEIVFVRNATEGINLIAYAYAARVLHAGDAIVSSVMEHHSNLVPWQQLAALKSLRHEFIPITKSFELDLSAAEKIISREKPRIVSITHASNVLGTITPATELSELSHAAGALFVLDAAQSAAHVPIDVKKIDCDFLVFSSHKLYGPSGVGVLYGKKKLLDSMQPFLYGGEMIESVSFARTRFNKTPYKFEAGTPNIEGAVGLATAIKYLKKIGLTKIRSHEENLLKQALRELKNVSGIKFFGPRNTRKKTPLLSFTLGKLHAHDIAGILDEEGIEIRSGFMCAQPLVEQCLKLSSIARASFALYNNSRDVLALRNALKKVERFSNALSKKSLKPR